MKYSLFKNFFYIFIKNKIYNYINTTAIESQRQIRTFGIIFFINYPLYYLIWKFISIQSYENLALRISASLLCIPLIFNDQLKGNIKKFFPLYWYFTVIYCLPFFFLFMMLNNHGSAPWLLNLFLQIFLTFLILNLIDVIVVNILGFALALIVFNFVEGREIIFEPSTIDIFGTLSTIVATFVVGSIFVHNRGKIELAKLESMKSLGTTIAHELRTPLGAISSAAGGIKNYLPALIDGYKLAEKEKLPVMSIDPTHYKTLLTACDEIESEAQAAFTIINMLLINVGQSSLINTSKFKICSIKRCIEEALRRYPFDLGEREIIHCDDNEDFNFMGDELLTVHILFNLLKNAFYQIKAVNKGEIYISLKLGSKYNELHFKDTAKGISPKALPHIFDRFYSKTYHGTGIGLAFCKMIMEASSGSIACHSTEGEYAEFILYFPIVPTASDSQQTLDKYK